MNDIKLLKCMPGIYRAAHGGQRKGPVPTLGTSAWITMRKKGITVCKSAAAKLRLAGGLGGAKRCRVGSSRRRVLHRRAERADVRGATGHVLVSRLWAGTGGGALGGSSVSRETTISSDLVCDPRPTFAVARGK
jgi:hypothetical protein